jgi:hypothetical protein
MFKDKTPLKAPAGRNLCRKNTIINKKPQRGDILIFYPIQHLYKNNAPEKAKNYLLKT